MSRTYLQNKLVELETLVNSAKTCGSLTPCSRDKNMEIAALLAELGDKEVDLETLRHTNAGHIINSSWLRLHEDEKIRDAGKNVADQWKS